MGVLSMNPNNPELEEGPKLAHRIAADEDWISPTGSRPLGDNEDYEDKQPPKKMKLGSFEIDTTYPRTLLGFIRICQVLLLMIAFVCLVATASWPDQGTYAFFCIFLVFGVLISAYFLFTVITGIRKQLICGLSWITVELVYFSVFGFIIFIGSCLAANKSEGNSSLTAAAVFGLGAVVTFVYYFWNTWKLRKAHLEALKEETKVSEENDTNQDGDTKFPTTPGLQNKDKGTLEREAEAEHNRVFDKSSACGKGATMPIKSRKLVHASTQGRPNSNSKKMFDHILQKESMPHLNHQLYSDHHASRGMNGIQSEGRIRKEQPKESFANKGYDHDEDPATVTDPNKSMNRLDSMPDWLIAALGNELDSIHNVVDERSESGFPPFKHTSTLPQANTRNFLPLNASEEESINYPSISQHGVGGQFNAHPYRNNNRSLVGGVEVDQHRHHRLNHQKRRRDNNQPSGRRPGHHRKMHHYKHLNRKHRPRGRKPLNEAHSNYLRQMVANDELVSKDGITGNDFNGNHAHHNKQPTHMQKRNMKTYQQMSKYFSKHANT